MTDLRSTLVIEGEIGHGHFGRVHLGHDGIRERLAVKVLRQLPTESQDEWNRRKEGLLREGASLEKARHPNVVEVYYLTEAKDADAVHLVMEHCDGGSLESEYQSGPMDPDRVLKIAREICLGLASLHDRGMIHRDIKPGNILINTRNVAKLGDFGFVTDEIVEGYAAGGGYRDHLAPEFYSDRISSVRTDLWALGVTLYRLIHGHPWYASGPAPRTVVPDGGYADRLKWLPHVGKGWRRLIRSLINDDPHSRPENARAVLRALSQIEKTGWSCTIGGDQITWVKRSGYRRIEVTLDRHSKRSFSWSAVSYPTGQGKKRTLASGSNIGLNQAEKELRRFFEDDAEKSGGRT